MDFIAQDTPTREDRHLALLGLPIKDELRKWAKYCELWWKEMLRLLLQIHPQTTLHYCAS